MASVLVLVEAGVPGAACDAGGEERAPAIIVLASSAACFYPFIERAGPA